MSSSPSAHAINLKGESSSRLLSQNVRLKQEYDRRLLSYEKEFDVGFSRASRREKGLNESMLAYTERARKITSARMNPDQDIMPPEGLPLVVRAKHIPKFPASKTKRTRPASLDELIGKSKAKRDKPKSASRLSLPMLPEKYGRGSHHVKISFVSASDLYDIVDFSIRNKANKEETLKFLKMANIPRNSRKSPNSLNRTNVPLPREAFQIMSHGTDMAKDNNPDTPDLRQHASLPPIQDKEVQTDEDDNNNIINEIDNELKNTTEVGKLAPDALKRRPNRARRMQLNKPDLRSIPEDEIASLRRSGKSERTVPSPPPKKSPRNVINVQSNLTSIPENDHLSEQNIVFEKKKISKLTRKDNPGVTAMVKLEPFAHLDRDKHTEVTEVDPHLKVKMKAQKRFRKLIFLRDVPDRNNRI